ncbi:WW domain-containing protein [Striga asiatica]|uniref:WW domain-containing protein n=1 Tax=Striga asiatica TaxID=4170 RepID=A0A5A7R872_STRAF|nr:WW domain-containing protein [Striga asiatica]
MVVRFFKKNLVRNLLECSCGPQCNLDTSVPRQRLKDAEIRARTRFYGTHKREGVDHAPNNTQSAQLHSDGAISKFQTQCPGKPLNSKSATENSLASIGALLTFFGGTIGITPRPQVPCASCEVRGAKGWLSSFSMSMGDFLDRLFMTKNATIAPMTRIEITIPAIAPPPMPEEPPPPPDEPSPPLPPPPRWFRLGLTAGGVPGGGGGAGPELN